VKYFFGQRFHRMVSWGCVAALVVSTLPAYGQPPRRGFPGGKPSWRPGMSTAGARPGTGEAEQPDVKRTGRMISLNFRDAPLDQVLSFYAELTGRTIIKAPGLNATITLRGQTRLTEEEAKQAIETVLAMHNISMVPLGDKFLKVVQAAAVRQEGIPTQMEIPETAFPEVDSLISQIVELKYVDFKEIQPIIQSLMHGYGKIQALERTNALLITDTANNLQRILEIIEYLDRPMIPKVETRIYELRYAEAGKVAAKLQELIQESQEKSAPQPQVKRPVTPPGVIRPRVTRAARPQVTAAELAERGIIRGKVKMVSDDRTNILIIISPPENFAFFDKIVSVLDRPVEPEIVVKVVKLEYADAEEIASILNEFVGAAKAEKEARGVAATEEGKPAVTRAQALEEYISKQAQRVLERATEAEKAAIGRLSPSTKILADKRTNALLLMGRRADIAALEDIIAKLDIMLPQVLIEAVIMEVGLSDDIQSGIDWLQRSMTVYNEERLGPYGGITVRRPVFSFGGSFGEGPFLDASKIDRTVKMTPATLTYYTTFFDLNLDVVIRLVQRSGNARILQTPVILTTDNTEAKIIVGEERPVVTSTSITDAGMQTSQYEYRNIGINLTVTPRINPQKFVVLEISQQADDFLETVKIDENEVPVIIKREMSAEIAVANRETVVLGGLVNRSRRRTEAKIPVLGDIPLLGALFRTRRSTANRRELMVMITPYVLSTPEELRAETRRLHRASLAHTTDWYRGWSASELAKIPPAELRRMRREEQRKRKLQLRMRLNSSEATNRTATAAPSSAATNAATPRVTIVSTAELEAAETNAAQTTGTQSAPRPAGDEIVPR